MRLRRVSTRYLTTVQPSPVALRIDIHRISLKGSGNCIHSTPGAISAPALGWRVWGNMGRDHPGAS